MSSVSTSAAVGPIELSVRNRHEDADVVPILDDGNDILVASRLADSTVPDGGYGWILIAACGIVTFWFVGVFQSAGPITRRLLSKSSQPDPLTGTSYCWGVLQAALVAQSLSSPSTLSFVGSLWTACIAVLALVNARIIRALGAQKTGLLGIGLLGLGEVASSFSTKSVGGLFATTGVVMGIGTR